MTQDYGKNVALRTVEAKYGQKIARGSVVTIANIDRMFIVEADGVKMRITGEQFRRDFLQYALAETVAAESQAVR